MTGVRATLLAARLGRAVVLHGPDGMSDEARTLASTAADPESSLVVADLPGAVDRSVAEAVASGVEEGLAGDGSVRLVVTGPSRGAGRALGDWLAARLGRPVVAADGPVVPSAGGGLFVYGGQGGSWVRCRPGHGPVPEGIRQPRPEWESPAVGRDVSLGPQAAAEPLPAGMWLRSDGDQRWMAANRARLLRGLVCLPDDLLIVLGGQGLPPLTLDEIGQFWAGLDAGLRARARFVHYGPVGTGRSDRPFGSVLAEALGEQVACYTGFPVGSMDRPHVVTIRPDGSHGWPTFAQLCVYPADGTPPRPHTYRAPLPGLAEIAAGVYRYTADAVLEIVPAGLWVRPAESATGSVRSTPADAERPRIFHSGDRLRALAEEVLGRLGGTARNSAVLAPVPVPEDDRSWLRETWREQFDAQRENVEKALAASSGRAFRRGADALADAVAVRLYLAGAFGDLDTLLRDGEPGDHERLGRCVAVGLARLPEYRGVAGTRLTPTAAEWAGCRESSAQVEPALLNLLTEPCRTQHGEVDVLVWSMNGRRTALLEPVEDPVPDRVVFRPGTRFKVLARIDADNGKRARILLRELSPGEVDATGAVASNRRSFDKLARAALDKAADRWAGEARVARIPAARSAAFQRLPGPGLAG